MTDVPTEADWGDYRSDLDAEWSHRTFAGRTNQEMQLRFRQCVLEATDDIRWMPEVPFRYYMLGFRDFVMAGDIPDSEASDAASCFLRLVLEKLEKQPDHILPIMPELLSAVRYVAENQALFDADEEIYGDFRELLRKIETLNAGLKPHAG